MGILHNSPPASKVPPILRLTDAEIDSLDADHTRPSSIKLAEYYARDAAAKERARHREIERRFRATGVTIDELADVLVVKMAVGIAEIVGVVMDERGTP